MKGQQQKVELRRPVARRTLAAAMIASVILSVGTPLALYWKTREAQQRQAASHAQRMATIVRDVVTRQPDLWFYDTPKLARHLALLAAAPDVAATVIVDASGRRVDVSEAGRSDDGALHHWSALLRWADAPVYRGSREVARVWVALDGTPALSRVLLVLLVAILLGASLPTVLYVVPVAAVSRAEIRIQALLDALQTARDELRELNLGLERRVEERSRQLQAALEALRESQDELRQVASRAAEATELERARVARELHDGVGQLLTGLHLELDVLRATSGDNPQLRAHIDDATALVDESIDELRRIARDLHPAALDRLGLLGALREHCQSVASRAGLAVELQAEAVPDDVPTAVGSALYRIAQEAMNNILRYAEARTVVVTLASDGDRLRLRIEDDGRGFDVEANRSGLGLRGMEDRAALLGGTVLIRSAPGEGTTIEVTIPLGPGRRRDGGTGRDGEDDDDSSGVG